MKLVRSIFLALAFAFTAASVAQAADPAPAGEAPAADKKEKKAKKGKKAEGDAAGGEKKAEEKAK